MKTKLLVGVIVFLVSVLFGVPSAQAMILNYGVDICYLGSYSPVPFFDGDNTGTTLWLLRPNLSLTLDTASVFGGYTVNSARLFVDATGIAPGWFIFPGSNGTVSAQGTNLGALANTIHANTNVPDIDALPTPTYHTPYATDEDNSFFDLGALGVNLNDLATDSTFTIGFSRTSGNFRLDGINIQADVSQAPGGGVIPEPASLSLLGLGLFGLVGLRKKK